MGLGRRRDKQGSPAAHLAKRVEDRAARRRIHSMRRKPAHPDAEGIEDNGGDENGEHQRPAAKVIIKFHRIDTVCGLTAARTEEARPVAKTLRLVPASDVTYDGYA